MGRADRLGELAAELLRYTDARPGEYPWVTAIEGFTVLRADRERQPSHRMLKPALCLTVQGSKWAIFGERRYVYGAGEALVVGVEMPSRGTVSAASPEEPYLGLVIAFDLAILREVMEETGVQAGAREVETGVFVAEVDEGLADCALRGMRLLETPEAIPVLYPGIQREICFRVLQGPGGARLARTLLGAGHGRRVMEAIHELRARFRETIRVEALAAGAGMSLATFHRQFKAVTSMTPLQFQKQMRLLEARRLLVASEANVETAAYRVGYESASQFSREYRRMFGRAPRRDASVLRGAAAAA